jgi:hypothetical protein
MRDAHWLFLQNSKCADFQALNLDAMPNFDQRRMM